MALPWRTRDVSALGSGDRAVHRGLRLWLVVSVLWSGVIGALLWQTGRQAASSIETLATVAARDSLRKDMAYRLWVSTQGGVYVPITERTPPNPYLEVPERDITTPSGRRLTLINPAYMTRQVHEFSRALYGSRGHITSLKPLRPENFPDPWERRALSAFERGETEYLSVEAIDGQPHLRLMHPLVAEAACLKCHAHQGYKEGDIRGGLSVAIDLAEFRPYAEAQTQSTRTSHGIAWALGLAVFAIGIMRIEGRRRERDLAVAALSESEARFRNLFEDSPIALLEEDLSAVKARVDTLRAAGILALGPHLAEHPEEVQRLAKAVRIVDVNEAAWRMLRVPSREAVGQDLARYLAPSSLEAFRAATVAVLGGETRFSSESDHLDLDGRVMSIEMSLNVAQGHEETLDRVLISIVDITARKQAEAQREALRGRLLEAEKLESIGRLAGGVAHDFNNVLAVILLEMDALQECTEVDAEMKEGLVSVAQAANRAAALTRQLLMFSRRSVFSPRSVDLNTIVADLLKMVERLLGAHFEICFEVREPRPVVFGDPGMIEQVIMNLCVNARDAMPEGGRVTLETRRLDLEPPAGDPGEPRRQAGPYICLSVADHGVGMEEETVRSIFEPFFTTKAPGRGTGLGLATVHAIVAQHGGFVEVDSRLGIGTTFRVMLPTTVIPIVASALDRPKKARQGNECILVVEDDVDVRRMLVRLLTGLGYRILEAGDGPAALELFARHHPEIDLLFSDLMMPGGLTGLQLAARFRVQRPGLPVVISSGYSEELAGADGASRLDGMVYLPKPYTPSVLGQVVRDALDAATPLSERTGPQG